MKTNLTRSFAGRSVMALISLTLLSSCVSQATYRYQPDSTAPRRGQKPYTINGERYEPLASHEGFVQQGIASWYGSDFHGKPTSSGETYDMYAMTAAHKTLPLGVYVKVRNQGNGREKVVRINDRGPFVNGRIIDLSYSAAKDLGLADCGTAAVRIEALGYADRSDQGKVSYRAPASYDRGAFGIQVGSYSKLENAQRMASDMKRRYGSSTIREALVHGARFYRVHAGNYPSLKEAEQMQKLTHEQVFSKGFIVALD